jgi:hypothetical protein
MDESFELTALFNLASGSNGINPAGEDVSVSLGSSAFTIPAGSFKANKNGTYAFEGKINRLSLEANIKPTTTGYQLSLEGSGLTGLAKPLTVALWIGDDSGVAQITH